MLSWISSAWLAFIAHYSLSRFALIVGGTFVVHELAWLAANLPFMLADDRGWWRRYKLRTGLADAQRHTHAQRWAAFSQLARGHVLQLLPVTAAAYPLLSRCFAVDAPLPSAATLAAQFLVFNVLEDTGFYWAHRWLHRPDNFRRFHAVHHAHIDVFSLTGEISHPVEFAVGVLVPIMAGPVLLGLSGALGDVHLLWFWAWTSFRECRGAEAHSGYELPFHPLRLLGPVYGGPRFHGFHHLPKGFKANFGGYRVWDWLLGTDAAYYNSDLYRQTLARNGNGAECK